jgi:hypothetical protein
MLTCFRWREDVNYVSRDLSDPLANTSLHGTDDIHLWVHYFDPSPAMSVVNVPATPVEYATSGDQLPNKVGLGTSSTLIESLMRQQRISARTFSLMVGDGMPRAGPGIYNGSLTFGGYDSARITGKVHTYPMDVSQIDFMPVTVQDIILDDPNDSTLRNRSILDNGATFEARITTDQYPMLLPAAVTSNFANLLGATPSNSEDGSLQAPAFGGVMRIRLSDGFEITLPSQSVVTTSMNNLTPIQENTDDNYNGPFYLSLAWLSQVLLTLDYDEQQFHLSQAILEDTYIVPRTLCRGATPVAFNYGSKNSSFVKNGMIGAVLGGVIAGVAATIMVVWTVVWWRRQRLIKEQQRMWALQDSEYKDNASDAGGEGREVEMRSLSPEGKAVPFAWVGRKLGKGKGKGKEAAQPVPQDEATAYQGRTSSDDIGVAERA